MTSNQKKKWISCLIAGSLLALSTGCSSTPPVKTLAYAKLNNERTYENDFAAVWKALEESLRNFKITDRSPDDVDPIELKRLTRRTLDTDWIYTQSRDKYQEYKINGTPRKVNLQSRYRYHVEAKKVMGGVTLIVKTDEEVERLKEDGTSAGYSKEGEPDPSRPSELLDKVQRAILAAPVI